MARSPRIFTAGTVYCAHCRTARGEMVFSIRNEASKIGVDLGNAVALVCDTKPAAPSRLFAVDGGAPELPKRERLSRSSR